MKIKERPDLVLINKKRTCHLVDFEWSILSLSFSGFCQWSIE